MTPKQAIDILEEVTGKVQLSRKDHKIILEAIELLRSITAPKPDTKVEE